MFLASCGPQEAAECTLDADAATATVLSPYSPIGQTAAWDSDVLAIRSRDDSDWTNVGVTIYGFETTNTRGKQPTGAFKTAYRKDIDSAELVAYASKDFESDKGNRWVSLTMNAEQVDLTVMRNGRVCHATVAVVR